ncbi:Carboxylesterase [Dictyocaulus viviparus]|uniref:Carboxylic ester hydrolase n=1 Tax=Dictyocaulus viviparus TaxID=29172 RepID=A0A0D8XRD1_DICVI|nr:Carboxylesterase [Dictyocaulus viviparus]
MDFLVRSFNGLLDRLTSINYGYNSSSTNKGIYTVMSRRIPLSIDFLKIKSECRHMGAGSSASSPSVKTLSGSVRGREYILSDGRAVDMYLGIPYAEPPIGNLRFKKPQPIRPWTDELQCVEFGPRCPQKDEYFAQVIQFLGFINIVGKSENNCLTVNVFTPRWRFETEKKFPVMVWIHGGGFSVHSSSNYGNMGLWDQTLALQWVHDNIEAFGGDPKNVTVFGQSAGGASADLLAISPHSRNLFHRVIPMAGSGECEFALRTNQSQAKLCREYARFLGWVGEVYYMLPENDSNSLMNFMKAQPSSRIEVGIRPKKDFHSSQSGSLLFVPNYDGDFFPKPIDELRRESPRKPIMIGTTQHEGLFFVALGGFKKTTEGFKGFCRGIIRECDYDIDTENIRREIYDFYMKDVNPKDKAKITERFVELLSDYAINVGVMRYVEKMTEYGNDVYFYCLEYFNPDGFGLLRFLLPFKGATHCSEVRYVLGKGIFSKFKPNENDLKMLEIMTNFFTNFAKYGNPNGDQSHPETKSIWEPYDISKPYRHLRIQLPTPVMSENYQRQRTKFWDRVINKNRTKALL